ncbi:MAG: site-specific DNA-methyltransferase [Ketobacter sp.]|nr:site-specific DNA-methyltransferase [Ketobacter sp.]
MIEPYEINKIYAGECADMMSKLPSECIDLTCTSPPYDNLRDYNGFTFDYKPVLQQLYRVTKPGGVVVWVVADATIKGSETGTSFRQALYAMECGFNCETMIYQQAGTGAKGSNYYYWQSFEYMFVFAKGQPKTSNRLKDKPNSQHGKKNGQENKVSRMGTRTERGVRVTPKFSARTNVWRYQVGNNGDDKTNHQAPFPESLARDHILSWSNPGDLVLDPFMGSGTTAKMAYQNGRNYLGFDISAEYVELAKKRVAWANPPLIVVS